MCQQIFYAFKNIFLILVILKSHCSYTQKKSIKVDLDPRTEIKIILKAAAKIPEDYRKCKWPINMFARFIFRAEQELRGKYTMFSIIFWYRQKHKEM